jgi:nucleotide-binding universal stress UspA family protein
MSTIIVLSDFSNASRNALKYAASFSQVIKDADVLLLNIYTVPASYSGEALALAAVRDALADTQRQLEDELEWAKENCPGVPVRYKAVAGNFIASLQEQAEEEEGLLIVMGTAAGYGQMSQWDVDSLHALTDLVIPVLTVPKDLQYSPIHNIAFACLPATITKESPFAAIKLLLAATGARLHVVTVLAPERAEAAITEGEALLHSQLPEPGAEYHTLAESHIVAAIGHFVEEKHIDLLLVMPGRHGLWYKLFHKSYSRELARLNLIPVMALHESKE